MPVPKAGIEQRQAANLQMEVKMEGEGMTFDQFRATGKDCDDLGSALNDATWEDNPEPGRGRLYLDVLYIERKPARGWLNGLPQEWYLLIGRDDWLSDDLEALEKKLYEFAIAEGYCSKPGPANDDEVGR